MMSQLFKNRYFILCSFLFLLRLLFPGDISFLHDEAMLLERALNSLSSGEIIHLGLRGTRGFRYGPVGPNFYVFLLFLTKNVYSIIFFKTIIVTLLNIFGVSLILKNLKKFDNSMWLFIFLSPCLFIYSRILWDNIFLIPLTSISIGAYFEYNRTEKKAYFILSIISISLALLTHLMVLPVCLTLGVHFAIFHLKKIKTKWPLYLLGIIIVIGMLAPYFSYVFGNIEAARVRESSHNVFLFPFMGIKFFSFIDFEYFFGKKWERLFFNSQLMFQIVRSTKIIWYLFYGVAFAGIWKIFKTLKTRDFKTTEFHASFFVVITLIFHLLLCVSSNLYKNPHYFNGVWVIHFLILGFGIEQLKSRIPRFEYIKTGYICLMFVFIIGLIFISHFHQGARSKRYGANLNQQVQVAKTLNTHQSIQEVEYLTPHLWFAHLSIDVLRKLEPASLVKPEPNQSFKKAKIDWAHPRHNFQNNGYAQLKVSFE